MSDPAQIQFWSSILEYKNIKVAAPKRRSQFLSQTIIPELLDKYKTEGWDVDKIFANKIRIKKLKPVDIAFEDDVWAMFAALGFEYLNKDRHFRLPYSDDLNLTQQIDVFAADNETILIVECKASDGEIKKGNFKECIEAIGGKKEGIYKALKKLFPDSKHKIKLILATKNYVLSEQDKARLENFDILHFDEYIIKYYEDLSKHLGLSARFQLLGNLFAGQTIPQLDNLIPAIQGKMGGHTYYSFSIEPEKLLKIGYVLHRNQANKKLMPTYQRLIKKKRLVAVQDFIDEGGFFPNSIIININTNGKKMRFDPSSSQVSEAISKIGVLHLPKNYRSAFIIDGQHRLYGYANSEYKTKNTIPVVAFIDLDRWEQVRLFMQINENQKAVPRSLKNDLDADLLWDAESPKDRIKALKLYIAKSLGEESESPLFDKIILGENPKTAKRCITTEAVRQGLDRSNFFPTYAKTSIVFDGSLFRGDNDNTYDIIFDYLTGCFTYVSQALPNAWEIGESSDGFLSINAGVESLIRIFSDIIDHIRNEGTINPKAVKPELLVNEAKYYLDPMNEYLKNIDVNQANDLRKSYGTAGRAKYWRILQKSIHETRNQFRPDGYDAYWRDEAKRFNTSSIEMIRDIEMFFKDDFKAKLESFYGGNWFEKGVPPQVQDNAVVMAQQKNREIEELKNKKTPWDCLNIIDYRKIATYGSNWRDIFEKIYTEPSRGKKSGSKDDKTSWMQKLEKIRNQNFHEYSVKEEEYEFITELHDWLIKKKFAE